MQLATICYLVDDGKVLFMYRNKKEGDINKHTRELIKD